MKRIKFKPAADAEPLPAAIRRGLLSVNQLAQLTRKDRRTVMERIQELPAKEGEKGALLYHSAHALEAIYSSKRGASALDQARTELALAQKRLNETKNEELQRIRIPIDVVISAHDQALQAFASTLKAARDKTLTFELINELLDTLREIPKQLKW